MESSATWNRGDQVVGTYCGVAFQGAINKSTRPTPDYRNVIFGVTLKQPITVYGEERQRIEVWTNSADSIEFARATQGA